MLHILRERMYLMLMFVLIIGTFSPIIYHYRDQIRSRVTHFFYPIEYNKSLAISLMEDADQLLETDDFPFSQKNSFIDSPIDLKFMKKSCRLMRKTDLQDPKWLEEKKVWLIRKKNKESKIATYISVNPQEYWDFHIEKVLKSLDYYNRSFNFSGPMFKIPQRLAQVSFAACRKEQAYLTYSLYIFKTEQYVQEILEKKKQIRASLTSKQANTIVWSHIKKSKTADVSRRGYIFANLEIINSNFLPPIEVDNFYERVIFFIPQNSLKRNLYFYKRGLLNSQIAEKYNDQQYYQKSLLYLQASVDFQNLKIPMAHQLNELETLQIQRSLQIIKILSKLQKEEQLLKTIQNLDYTANRIRKSAMTNFQKQLIDQYQTLKKQVLLQAGYDI